MSTDERTDSAQQGRAEAGVQKVPSGLLALALTEEQVRGEAEARHGATGQADSSSSSASFDSWRLDGQQRDGTDAASTSQLQSLPLPHDRLAHRPAAALNQGRFDDAVLAMPQLGHGAFDQGHRGQGKEGWTDWLVSQVQQSGLMPGRQNRPLGHPQKLLQSPSPRQADPKAAKLGQSFQRVASRARHNSQVTPLSEQGSTGATPLVTRQRHVWSPAGSGSSTKFGGGTALSPLASALAGIRCSPYCLDCIISLMLHAIVTDTTCNAQSGIRIILMWF